ncbi:MAG: Flp pilus assembly protein CpaB [Gammaproteobacteria bacterium RIFCSPHIGHO2_12_FULL_37_14]|nr:MAG: Flp pilus assembly protein CpaB [Gammaproteobacteria bacterium RIFCSPHIGHO2_12_FULL_37_14]
MNQRTMYILGALILAIIVTLVIFKQKKTKTTSTRATVSILFATKDISAGKALQAGDFDWRALSKNDVLSPDLIVKGSRRDQDLIGSKILIPLIADQPIKSNMIVAKGVLSPLASILKPGMRAFTVDISVASALAGLIKPGDIVDIILTYKKSVTGREPVTLTDTIIHNVHVIAVDDRILYLKPDEVKSDRASQRSTVKHITLELMPKQAEALATAKAMGTISLSLTVPTDLQQPIEAEGENAEEQTGISLYHGEKVEEY